MCNCQDPNYVEDLCEPCLEDFLKHLDEVSADEE